ncbi:MAG: hypothetical protein ACLUS6_03800 [Dysosmobacter sp.]
MLYRDDNHHLIDAHLSTFAKQKWWKDERMLENDMYYLPHDGGPARGPLGIPARRVRASPSCRR